MPYAIDLSPRQSARTLEQAVRHQAQVVLEPRLWSDGGQIRCRLAAYEYSVTGRRPRSAPLLLMVDPEDAGSPRAGEPPLDTAGELARLQRFNSLLGTYCDAVLELGDHRYMFSADIVRVEPSASAHEGPRLYLSRPEVVQVAQRRRFGRVQLAHSSQIEIRWIHEDGTTGGGVGWLYNISPDGLACRTDAMMADRLWIGQELRLDFTLKPGDPEHFVLSAVLCNKTAAGTTDRMILGLQFLSGPGYESSATMREALRRRLYGTPVASFIRKGVDA